MTAPKLVVLDVDGTLAYNGDLEATPSGPSRAGILAIEAIRDRVTIALVSGHSMRNLKSIARGLGIKATGAELGSVFALNGDRPRLTVPWDHDEAPAAYARRVGVVTRVLEAYPCLSDAATPRSVTVPLKGDLDHHDAREARALVESIDPALTLLDNGRGSGLRTLHIAPHGAGKPAGIRALQNALGVNQEDTIMIGDSPQDAACHAVVRLVYILANGDPAEEAELAGERLRRTKAGYGPGVAEALAAEFGGQVWPDAADEVHA